MDELLQHLMEHPSLVKGVGLGARSKEAIDREWTNLATRLNAHGNGATKTGQRWKRYWADLKFKTKNKVSARRREAFSTGGGGPATLEDLSENDKKILAIIGEGAVFGDTQYRVPILVSSTESSVFNTLSTSTQSTSTQSTSTQSACNTKEYEEVIVTATDTIEATKTVADDPQQPPATSGRIFDTTEATAGSPRRAATSRRIFESPVSRRRLRQPRCSNSSTLTREVRTGQRVDQSWVVELERRRVDAECRLADAAMITAEAARVQAEAARMQAEAARDQAAAFNKLLDMYLKK